MSTLVSVPSRRLKRTDRRRRALSLIISIDRSNGNSASCHERGKKTPKKSRFSAAMVHAIESRCRLAAEARDRFDASSVPEHVGMRSMPEREKSAYRLIAAIELSNRTWALWQFYLFRPLGMSTESVTAGHDTRCLMREGYLEMHTREREVDHRYPQRKPPRYEIAHASCIQCWFGQRPMIFDLVLPFTSYRSTRVHESFPS